MSARSLPTRASTSLSPMPGGCLVRSLSMDPRNGADPQTWRCTPSACRPRLAMQDASGQPSTWLEYARALGGRAWFSPQLGRPRRRGRASSSIRSPSRPLVILHKLGVDERIRSAADRGVPIWPSSPQTPRSPSATATSALGSRLRVGASGADASFEAADPLPEHVPLLHRTPRCVLRLASPAGALVERPPFLVDRARVRRVVDGEPRAASLDPTDTAGRIGWAWGSERPGQHPVKDPLAPRCSSHDSPRAQASPRFARPAR
jgi:hypothetical protein